jgi:hypothetical protein
VRQRGIQPATAQIRVRSQPSLPPRRPPQGQGNRIAGQAGATFLLLLLIVVVVLTAVVAAATVVGATCR